MDNIKGILKLLSRYKSLVERTVEQLNEEEIHLEPAEGVNSIAIIVKHLHGNMLSRWTNFLTEDGEKAWRERDAEFEDTITSKKDLLDKWEEGWSYCFDALNSLEEKHLQQIIRIRNEEHTVMEAIERQLAHSSYHIGQIVFLGKMIRGNKWESLSIPKGQSKAYNEKKFAEGNGG